MKTPTGNKPSAAGPKRSAIATRYTTILLRDNVNAGKTAPTTLPVKMLVFEAGVANSGVRLPCSFSAANAPAAMPTDQVQGNRPAMSR